jgi:hypothetical protein
MPVITVNKVLDEKRIIRIKRAEQERDSGSLTPKGPKILLQIFECHFYWHLCKTDVFVFYERGIKLEILVQSFLHNPGSQK